MRIPTHLAIVGGVAVLAAAVLTAGTVPADEPGGEARVELVKSELMLYPEPDGFHDRLVIGAQTTSPSGIARGGIVISIEGQVVAVHRIDHTGVTSFTWDGRVGDAIRPGHYDITARVVGADGVPTVVSTSIAVYPQRVVTPTRAAGARAARATDGV